MTIAVYIVNGKEPTNIFTALRVHCGIQWTVCECMGLADSIVSGEAHNPE